jgi:hypothetical protein
VAANSRLKLQGRRLTFRAYKSVGKYSTNAIIMRFGRWNDGLRRAGLALNEEKGVSTETLFDNLKIVWITKGKQPT